MLLQRVFYKISFKKIFLIIFFLCTENVFSMHESNLSQEELYLSRTNPGKMEILRNISASHINSIIRHQDDDVIGYSLQLKSGHSIDVYRSSCPNCFTLIFCPQDKNAPEEIYISCDLPRLVPHYYHVIESCYNQKQAKEENKQ